MSLLFLARRFVAGETFEDVIPVVRQLNRKGLHATVNMLGEHVREREAAARAAEEYLAVLDHIRRTGIDSNLSIKPTQMGLEIGDDFCYETLRPVVARAAEYGIFVRLDMEGSAYTQRTLDLFFKLYERYRNVGVVIQAYLYRSERDIDELNRVGARVRLCKGAYKEPARIAYQRMDEIRKNFLKLAERLLAHGHYPGIATHDDLLIEPIKRMAAERGIGRDQFEFQMLYGLRPETQERMAREGYHLRVYVPYGPHWLPYFYRRLRERKENIWFVLKTLFRG
ncbi:MAG: proline dehydrogenase [Acidobacteria bacterium]|nr:MAG: proline dehydrogenase [Acidobacteriota bacterium]